MTKNDINLNLYKTFYETAQYKSISKCAEKNYISQSAVSKSLKKLESNLNTQLFYRTNKGITLTDKGKELLFYIDQAYNTFAIARRAMLESETMQKGQISIGVPSQIGSFFIFSNIAKFHKEYPNIEITIISKSTSQLLNLLERHEIDFIIDTSPINTKLNDIKIIPLKEVQNGFVALPNFLPKKVSKLKDLEDIPVIFPIKGTNNRQELDTVLDKYQVSIHNIINIHTSEMIISAIKEQLGVGYLILDLVKEELASKELILLDLEEKLPTTTINLVYIPQYLTTAPIYFIKNYIKPNFKI